MSNITIAFILTFIAGLSTIIGALLIFLKDKRGVILKYSLSFAAGVMICVSIIDLIPEAIELLYKGNKNNVFLLTLIFIICGMISSFLIDKLIPENKEKNNSKLFKVGIFSMIAIILHNIPEGIATFLSSATNIKLGITLTIAIALHKPLKTEKKPYYTHLYQVCLNHLEQY